MKKVQTHLQQMIQTTSVAELYKNITGMADYYKYTHHRQYPKDLTQLFFYLESRFGAKYSAVCFFGLQMILKEHFMDIPSLKMVEMTNAWVESAGGHDFFASDAWKRVKEIGYLPIAIYALPEGTVVDVSVPQFKVTATEDWFTPHVGSLEDLLMHVWAPTAVASRILRIKERVRPMFEKCGCLDLLPFAMNDFSLRSQGSIVDAVRRGAAHLLFFAGSDNTPADMIGIMKHYNGPQVLKSVWATEHSVAESFGPGAGEKEYIMHQLKEAPDDALISLIIDTYDDENFMWNVVGDEEVKEMIKKRAGRTVFRTDSGNPGEKAIMCFEALRNHFGSHMHCGYEMLDHNVGTIISDSVDEDSSIDIYAYIMSIGWSVGNTVMGSGKGLMSGLDRDTQQTAMKANAAVRDGKLIPLFKSPKGSGFKKSKPGEIKVIIDENGRYKAVTSEQVSREEFDALKDEMILIYRNSQLIKDWDYEEVVAQMEATKGKFVFE